VTDLAHTKNNETFAQGGEGAPSPLHFKCGSAGYWLVTLATIPWVGVFFMAIRRRVLVEHEAKVRELCVFVEGVGHYRKNRQGGKTAVVMVAALVIRLPLRFSHLVHVLLRKQTQATSGYIFLTGDIRWCVRWMDGLVWCG
jgi:hypothetical protein